jgi:hypothetical protein
MSKVSCEDCYEAEAQIVYLVYNTQWSSCFNCLKSAINDTLTKRVMLKAVDEAED